MFEQYIVRAVNIQIQMFRTFLVFFLAIVSMAQKSIPVLISDPQITKVLAPAGLKAAVQMKQSSIYPNYIGFDAQWIWVNTTDRPIGFTATFETNFMSTCPDAPTTLHIACDDAFQAYLNGVSVGTGRWDTKYTFTLYPQCGWNNFTVTATDFSSQSLAGLIFAIVQNQTNCYQCGALAFYNGQTCKCECKRKCSCQHKLEKWANYPLCGCVCSNRAFTNCNPTTQFFNEGSCGCQCLAKICPENLQQDPQSCQCRCKQQPCEQGRKWSYSKCACIKKTCPYVATCQLPKIWDNNSCSCQCSTKPACSSHTWFDSNRCTCVSLQSQQIND